MDGNKDYEHPILGVITDHDVQHILALRELNERVDERIKRFNKIIESLAHSAEYAENSASLKRIVKRLEKFKEEEL